MGALGMNGKNRVREEEDPPKALRILLPMHHMQMWTKAHSLWAQLGGAGEGMWGRGCGEVPGATSDFAVQLSNVHCPLPLAQSGSRGGILHLPIRPPTCAGSGAEKRACPLHLGK